MTSKQANRYRNGATHIKPIDIRGVVHVELLLVGQTVNKPYFLSIIIKIFREKVYRETTEQKGITQVGAFLFLNSLFFGIVSLCVGCSNIEQSE